ncbi:relaxation protein [Lysobacter sp. CA196]|uniref:relaxation protein n=1 Tax=Lysobacter sp. CA196 TaxID=3455606 RepID=UPI003F8D6D64
MTALLGRTAVLMEQFERRCEEIGKHQRATCVQLQELSQQVAGTVLQSADESLRGLSGAVIDKVEGGLSQPVEAYEQRLQRAGVLLQQGSLGLAVQIKRLESLHGRLVWKVVVAAFAGVLLLLTGGGWLSWHYRAEVSENRVKADLMRAYNQADVSLCEGRLCANIDTKAKAYGDDKRYRPVRARR